MVFELFKKRFHAIVGGRHIRDAIAGEETPPAMPYRLGDLGDHFGRIGLLLGGLRQTLQEGGDSLLDLAHRSPLTVFIFGIETAV